MGYIERCIDGWRWAARNTVDTDARERLTRLADQLEQMDLLDPVKYIRREIKVKR